jgi:sec-independent protein translocase protein TatC
MSNDEGRMPFTSHLTELRTRLVNIVIGVAVASFVTFFFRNELYTLLVYPLAQAWDKAYPGVPIQLHFTSPVEVFMAPFKVSLVAAVFVASPVFFHQMWSFIAPGLYPRERKFVAPFIFVAVALFIGGALFAYYYVLPASFHYFLQISTSPSWGGVTEIFGHRLDVHLVSDAVKVTPMITLDEYLSLTLMLLLVFGAVFELPMLLAILAMLGVVSPGGLWRFNRFAILIAFIAGAVLTPGDLVVGQIAMGTALTVLYNLSILVALLVGRKKKAEEPVESEADEAAAGASGQ